MRVEVYKDTAGEWRWRQFASNGEPISESGEGYQRRIDAITGAVSAVGGGDYAFRNGLPDKMIGTIYRDIGDIELVVLG